MQHQWHDIQVQGHLHAIFVTTSQSKELLATKNKNFNIKI
jgi:hypothetical protein